ncbi:hypothetical protein FDE08_16095 [Vibrio parahaemolyticus]|uniref:hypothetical protein n=1 Tax=Vibrio parahaemolyticus TaxID=670 RepID=UPI00128F7955|nr:hypothetical protein [Vibrio parahaemolyticus]MQF57062.1 hypothetical protein [Vibrio parahaemolyticus]
MKIISKITGKLLDEDMSIEHVFHMPLVHCSRNMPKAFKEIFYKDPEAMLEVFGIAHVDRYDEDSEWNDTDDGWLCFLGENGVDGTLIQYTERVCTDYEYDEATGDVSFKETDEFSTHFAYGKNLQDATNKMFAAHYERNKQCIRQAIQNAKAAKALSVQK